MFSTNPHIPQPLDTTPVQAAYSGGVEEAAPTTVVVTPIECVECGRAWTSSTERWRLKVLFEDGLPETVPYCPACHAREFESD